MTKTTASIIILLLLILLSGCYSLPQPQTEISVIMHDNSFSPASWRVPAGATITLHLDNQDSVRHNWAIVFRQSLQQANLIDLTSIYWQYSIEAGQSETVQFTAPAAAGNYQVISSEGLEEGMVGNLTVVRLGNMK